MGWRLKRASSVEDSLFSMGHLDHAGKMNAGDAAVDSCLAEADGLERASEKPSPHLPLRNAQPPRRRKGHGRARGHADQTQRSLSPSARRSHRSRAAGRIRRKRIRYDPGDDFVQASAFVFSPRSTPRFGPPQPRRPCLEPQQSPANGPQSRLKTQI